MTLLLNLFVLIQQEIGEEKSTITNQNPITIQTIMLIERLDGEKYLAIT